LARPGFLWKRESRAARSSYQGSEMLTHQALEMLKRRTGLTKAQ
jgi:shikimate 5-dehydrogenase